MKITVHGSGYVGLVTAACFAHMGNDIMCVDIDTDRIEKLRKGVVPIREPGLDDLVAEGIESGRMRFTSDPVEGVKFGLVQFIAVGTPPDEDGSADLRYVLQVADTIGRHMDGERIIVDKSTVPVGTADKVQEVVARALAERDAHFAFDVVSNPEFLKEGSAVDDFLKPDRVIVGTRSERGTQVMRSLYAPFTRTRDRLMVMAVRDAEFTKYAANTMLATKISMMNEFANMAERLGVDIEAVRQGIGSDPRIGYSFIFPGCGYGGSCFPKDVAALYRTAVEAGYRPQILEAVEAVNARQKSVLFDKLSHAFKGDLKGKTIALWGLAFKPNTDDMREAPSRTFLEAAWAAGATVRAYDPAAMDEARRIYPDETRLVLTHSADEALAGADALVVVTEWPQFRSPDFEKVRGELSTPVIVDGRNLYDPEFLGEVGFTYYSIGRPVVNKKV
ncbi:MAG: UDP-glucose/GDP-mannose dehydrogenase family protein [Gammaproteobacteria bacterium]|jgi:UDPglucose 6-dehydrogenase